MKYKIYSFFSGIGFLDLGFENEKYDIALVNEFNSNFLDAYKFARKQLRYKNPQHGYYNCDINDFLKEPLSTQLAEKITKDKNDSLVGFIGGPPCPDFSIAGKNNGIGGEHGKLTTSYQLMILNHHPDFFVFENVKGLWNTKKHREEYDKLKTSFEADGYVLIDKLINSIEYGVPQDRERIILIGIRSEIFTTRRLNQDILKNSFEWGNKSKYSLENIKNIKWPDCEQFEENSVKIQPKEVILELTIEYWFRKNNVYNHSNSNDYFTPKSINKFNTIAEGDVSKKCFKRLHRWRYSPTVAYGNNEVHLHPYKSRRLSVAEALALQSLPSAFEVLPNLTLSDKFKTIGNGVPYLVSKAIAHSIKIFFNSIDKKD